MDAEDNSSLDSWLDSSLDGSCSDDSTDSWLSSGSDTENVDPRQIPSPIRKGRDYRKKNNFARTRAGRRPLHQLFPNLVDVATDFVTQNSYAAQSRRRSSVGQACGTSIPALKQHLEKTIPNLTISNTTCAKLMVPPNKKRLSSKTYKSLILAKVPPKKNNQMEKHIDSHYCNTTVKYRMEFAAEFSEEVAMFSCDCMNKVHIGGLAVSRYHQINRLHMLDDAPNYPDHDFPHGSGYLITPCGYMRLENAETERHATTLDDLGRQHLITPRTGRLNIVNRSQKFHKLTIQEHINDLVPIIKPCTEDKKTGIILLVDGGPDWSDASWTVLLYLSRIFRLLDLDFLCMTKYAPKNSAFNPIEHAWAPLSKRLTSVRLQSTVDGEDEPPATQSLTPAERKAKEARVFDAAMKDLNLYWDGMVFDGHQVKSTYHPCLDPPAPFDDYDKVHPLASAGSKSKLGEQPELMQEIEFAVKHAHRRPRELTLLKCTSRNCEFCQSHPVRAVNSMAEMRSNRGVLLLPVKSPKFPEHYQTYLELRESPDKNEQSELMPSFTKKELGNCPVCPCYMFSSKEDRKRHLAIIHHGQNLQI